MQGAGDGVTDEEVRERGLPGAAAVQDSPEPRPEEDDAGDLHAPRPPAASRALGVKGLLVEVGVRVGVEVEAGKGHDEVEDLVLHAEGELGDHVKLHGAFVVGGPEGVEECGGDGEEGHVLDVGVAT